MRPRDRVLLPLPVVGRHRRRGVGLLVPGSARVRRGGPMLLHAGHNRRRDVHLRQHGRSDHAHVQLQGVRLRRAAAGVRGDGSRPRFSWRERRSRSSAAAVGRRGPPRELEPARDVAPPQHADEALRLEHRHLFDVLVHHALVGVAQRVVHPTTTTASRGRITSATRNRGQSAARHRAHLRDRHEPDQHAALEHRHPVHVGSHVVVLHELPRARTRDRRQGHPVARAPAPNARRAPRRARDARRPRAPRCARTIR